MLSRHLNSDLISLAPLSSPPSSPPFFYIKLVWFWLVYGFTMGFMGIALGLV